MIGISKIRLRIIFIFLILFKLTFIYSQTIPSFPGAEGFGAVTVGGRGGEVIHVTNLNNSGPGSFRAACEAIGPRTVVFDVSGIIHLTEEIRITNSYITIAGQTAPGDGIIIAGATVNMTGQVNDLLIRYMRFRRSYDINGPFPTPNSKDAGQCLVGMSVSKNIMVDHVSASWGTDENMSMYRCQLDGGRLIPTKNITIQWCIISEALNPAGHAFANTWGGQGANQHHNLMACNVGRNPSISFSHFMDYRNNVIFNWRDRSMDGAGKEAHLNVINNYYKPGPATGYNWDWSQPAPELKVRIVKPEIRSWSTADALGLDKKARYSGPGVIGWWYIDGNVMEGYPEVTNDNWAGKSLVDGKYYSGVQWDAFVEPYPGVGPGLDESYQEWEGDYMTDHLEWIKVDTPHIHVEFPEDPRDPYDGDSGEIFVIPDLPIIATQTANEAYQSVLKGAGAILPIRDAVDVRTIEMATTGIATAGSRENGIIDHPDEVGGYPIIAEMQRPTDWDTDLDGMPDKWEKVRDLDPDDASDRNDDYDQDGYTNLEEYLNDIGAFKAIQAIVWDGDKNNRYAEIENWDIAFQPSRFDTAIIINDTVVVDAIDQHSGILKLSDNSKLNITNGWLDVANSLEVEVGCTIEVEDSGKLIIKNVLNNGVIKLFGKAELTISGAFTNNGTIDILEWEGTLPAGIINYGTIIDSLGVVTSFPKISITSPYNNNIFETSSNITISADASINNDSITSVDFFLDTLLVGSDSDFPYTYNLNNVVAGNYNITARANGKRTATISSIVNITVTGFPEITITSPSDNEIYEEPANIIINADASDNDGDIYFVEFFQDSASLGKDYISPYSYTWDSIPDGNYNITASATDYEGATTISSSVNIIVADVDTTNNTSGVNNIVYINRSSYKVKIYPVPVQNLLIIEFNQELKNNTDIYIFNITGNLIKQKFIHEKIKTENIYLDKLSPGIYFLNIINHDYNKTFKFIKN